MGKHDSAPTYGYVFTSWANRCIVRICLVTTACVIVAAATILARIDANCTDKPHWTWNVASYKIDFGVSKSVEKCG